MLLAAMRHSSLLENTIFMIVVILSGIIGWMVMDTVFFAIAIAVIGTLWLTFKNRLTRQNTIESMQHTVRLTSMVFLILIGATTFGLVFRGMGGDHLVHEIFTQLPGGQWGFLLTSLALIFLLGFFLDFLEICFIVVPILAPIAVYFQIDLLWFAILIAVNLQTSFLTPPFGFSLFYLKAVAPSDMPISVIYRGVIPFVILQLIGLAMMVIFPQTVLWLPNYVDGLLGL
jgi:TRAP-type mannitol/chloroaromatic compound transport system permease large subunit